MCPRAGFSLASIELEEWKNEIVFFKNLTGKKLYISVNLNSKRSWSPMLADILDDVTGLQ